MVRVRHLNDTREVLNVDLLSGMTDNVAGVKASVGQDDGLRGERIAPTTSRQQGARTQRRAHGVRVEQSGADDDGERRAHARHVRV